MVCLSVQLFSTLAGPLHNRATVKGPTDEPSEMNFVDLGSIGCMRVCQQADHYVKSQLAVEFKFDLLHLASRWYCTV
jgi:hypothetical protein